jgi:hypothetical protein
LNKISKSGQGQHFCYSVVASHIAKVQRGQPLGWVQYVLYTRGSVGGGVEGQYLVLLTPAKRILINDSNVCFESYKFSTGI